MKKSVDKTRIIVWGLVLLFALYVFTYGPSAVQNRNMQKAKEQLETVRKIISTKDGFENIRMARSTAGLGRYIRIHGTVNNPDDLAFLKSVIEENIDSNFKVHFSVALSRDDNSSEESSLNGI